MKWNFRKCQHWNLKWHGTKDGSFLCEYFIPFIKLDSEKNTVSINSLMIH